MNPNQPRDRGGRFGETRRHEPELDGLQPAATGSVAVLEADSTTLWGYVDDPDLTVRDVAARSTHLTSEQAAVLAGPDQPFTTRQAVSGRFDPEDTLRALADPDPVIRAQALFGPVGEQAGEALSGDLAVQRYLEVAFPPEASSGRCMTAPPEASSGRCMETDSTDTTKGVP